MTGKNWEALLEKYRAELVLLEMSCNTVRKYSGDVRDFARFAGCEADQVNKESVIAYKQYLKSRYKPNTVNSRIISLNRFFGWAGLEGLKVKSERVTRRTCLENVLSPQDYEALLAYAREHGKEKMYLIMRTLAGTGIRVGELRYITREAAVKGQNMVLSKGRWRVIFLSDVLCALLLDYCEKQRIVTGTIFTGRSGAPLDSSCIWRTLKRLAIKAGVDPAKAYPHSFRHLFAKTFLQHYSNLAELADILGHSSLETTRIYAVSTLREKRENMNKLSL